MQFALFFYKRTSDSNSNSDRMERSLLKSLLFALAQSFALLEAHCGSCQNSFPLHDLDVDLGKTGMRLVLESAQSEAQRKDDLV